MEPRKEAILDALTKFLNQRSGIEFGNYGDVKAFRAEQRSIYTDLKHARVLLAAVKWRDGIDADALLKASEGAFSGRLSIRVEPLYLQPPGAQDQRAYIDYVTGQYFPTEYRRAVCAVLASALWDYTRETSMPTSEHKMRTSMHGEPQVWHEAYGWMSPGDWLRAYFRKEFGRAIADRWFS